MRDTGWHIWKHSNRADQWSGLGCTWQSPGKWKMGVPRSPLGILVSMVGDVSWVFRFSTSPQVLTTAAKVENHLSGVNDCKQTVSVESQSQNMSRTLEIRDQREGQFPFYDHSLIILMIIPRPVNRRVSACGCANTHKVSQRAHVIN